MTNFETLISALILHSLTEPRHYLSNESLQKAIRDVTQRGIVAKEHHSSLILLDSIDMSNDPHYKRSLSQANLFIGALSQAFGIAAKYSPVERRLNIVGTVFDMNRFTVMYHSVMNAVHDYLKSDPSTKVSDYFFHRSNLLSFYADMIQEGSRLIEAEYNNSHLGGLITRGREANKFSGLMFEDQEAKAFLK